MASPVGGAEAGEVTTTLTCRSSRILVSSFGRASRAARSKAGTGSTFARQSEKRTKYGRKRGEECLPPPLSPSAVSNEVDEMPGGRLSIRNLSLLLIPFRNSHLDFDSIRLLLFLFQLLFDRFLRRN